MAYSDRSSTILSRNASDTAMTDAPPMTAATQAFSSRSRSPASTLAYTETVEGTDELSPAGVDYSDMDTSPADYLSDFEHSTASAPPSDEMSSYKPTSRETKMEDLRSALESLGCFSSKTINTIVSNAGNPDYLRGLAEDDEISDVSEPSSAGRSMEGYTGGNGSGSGESRTDWLYIQEADKNKIWTMIPRSAQHLPNHSQTKKHLTNSSPQLIANSLYRILNHSPLRYMILMPVPGPKKVMRLLMTSSYWKAVDTCIHRILIACEGIDSLSPCCSTP